MGIPRVLKSNFSKGIVSPTIQSQVESEKYSNGVKNLKNMIVSPDGGIFNRPGTHVLEETKNVSGKVINRPYIITSEITYVLEIGPLYIRFFKDDGTQIESGGSPLEVVTTYLEDDLAGLRFTQSGNVLYIAHQNYPTKKLVRTSDLVWSFTDYSYVNGPFMPLNSDSSETITPSAVTGSITLTSVTAIFSNITGADHSSNNTLWQINEALPAQSLQAVISANGSTGSLKCGGTWRLVTHGTWTGTITIEISSDYGSTWKASRVFSSVSSINIDTFGTESGEQFLVRATVSNLTVQPVVIDLSTDAFIWHGVVKITAVPAGGGGSSQLYNTATATVIDQLASTSANNDWAEGSWSLYRGYPQAVSFYQDRLCFGGNVSEPQTVWMSETAYYESYKVHSPLRDSDSISVILPSRESNTIRHLIQLNDLLILTSSGEWSLTSENGVISPSTVTTRNNGKNGCSNSSPLMIGNRVIYIEKNETGLRDTGYNFESNGFEGISLNSDVKHLFKNRTIIEIAFQRNPYPVIWCICSDGLLLSLTYSRNNGVLAWSTHDTYSGLFKSVTTVSKTGYDEVWFNVYRSNLYRSGGALGLTLVERMLPRSTSSIVEDQFYMDCAIQFESPSVIIIEFAVNGFFLSPGHGFSDGDRIKMYNVNDRLNIGPGDSYYTITDSAATVFKLYYDDTTNYVEPTAAEVAAYTNYSGWVKKLEREVVTGDYLQPAIDYVDVMYDGQLLQSDIDSLGNKVVVGLDESSAYFTIGFRYECICELLPPIIGLNSGPSLGVPYAITRSLTRLYNSVGGQIGYDENNLSPIEEDESGYQFSKYYDSDGSKWIPDHLITSADAMHGIESKNSTDNNVYIFNDEPYPFEILLVVMFLDLGDG